MKFKELVKIFAPPFIVLLTHIVLSSMFHIYQRYEWFDIPMHFVGGLTAGFSFSLFLLYIQKENYLNKINIFLFLLFGVSMVALVVVGWEFLEYFGDKFLNMHAQASLSDTIGDLALGLFGGTLSCIVVGLKNR